MQLLRKREKIALRREAQEEDLIAIEKERNEASRFEKRVIEIAKKNRGVGFPEPIDDLAGGLKSLEKALEALKKENADLRAQLKEAKRNP